MQAWVLNVYKEGNQTLNRENEGKCKVTKRCKADNIFHSLSTYLHLLWAKSKKKVRKLASEVGRKKIAFHDTYPNLTKLRRHFKQVENKTSSEVR